MNAVAPVAGLLGALVTSLSSFKYILIAFIVFIVVWIFYQNRSQKNALDVRAIRDLVKSASQWNSRSIQDSNPIIGVMNANYAMAYLNVARNIGTDADIEMHSGMKIDALIKSVEDTQTAALQRITEKCPSLSPPGTAITGWKT
jgi:hypothetical protein